MEAVVARASCDDALALVLRHSPPPAPSERPVAELKRSHSAAELRRRLSDHGLPTRGAKNDLAIRVARHEAFVDVDDVARAFPVAQLRRRMPALGAALKHELCAAYLHDTWPTGHR